jgi:hypothetical protein
MELIKNKSIIKSKKPFKIDEILKYVEKGPNFELNVYFETIITKDPLKEDYNEEDNLILSYLGGLYCVVLNNENLKSNIFNKKEIQLNINETYRTAISLRRKSNK